MTMKITEGYMPFKGFQTYYRICGEGNSTPLILLHGGPGSTHNYFELLDALGDERPLIMYDQLGCGNSYLDSHPELWTKETWLEELVSLISYLKIERFHLLGQSWGGMLAIEYLLNHRQDNVASVILSSTLSSASLWSKEQHRLISFMSEEDQEAIYNAERTGNYGDPAYLAANARYMKLYCADIKDTDPECLTRKKRSGTESYITAWGPNEYTPEGTLKDFEYTDRLSEIGVPALIISGTNDLCTPLTAKTLYDGIPDSRWELFPRCRHMVFAEENGKYISLLRAWMKEHI